MSIVDIILLYLTTLQILPTSSLSSSCPQSPPTDFYEPGYYKSTTFLIMARAVPDTLNFFAAFSNIEQDHICTKYTLDYANPREINLIKEGDQVNKTSLSVNDTFIYDEPTMSFTYRYKFAKYDGIQTDPGYKIYRLTSDEISEAFAIYKCVQLPNFNISYSNVYIFFATTHGFNHGMDGWLESTVKDAVQRLNFTDFRKTDFKPFYKAYEKCKIKDDKVLQIDEKADPSISNPTLISILAIPILGVIVYYTVKSVSRQKMVMNQVLPFRQ